MRLPFLPARFQGLMPVVLIWIAALLAVFFCVAQLTGCSKPDASFADLEDARGTARENAMWNAQRYRQTNPLLAGWDIIGRGDSSQTGQCPQGDGWATMDFVRPDKTLIEIGRAHV